jgi:GNAT superfamily N-acetyltransferase
MAIEYREYRRDDGVEVCDLLNQVFSRAPISHEGWDELTAADFTAPVALLDGCIVGAIPMKRRVYRAAPGCDVAAWVLFRVGVSGDHQGQGIGSGMQQAIKEFLHDRSDILLVNTCGKATRQYQFYRRNGLFDVACPQRFTVEPLTGSNGHAVPGLRRVGPDEFLADRGRWVEIFESCYESTGGYPVRTEAYPFDWLTATHRRRALANTVYATIGSSDRPLGYAIFAETKDSVHVHEFAVRDGDDTVMAHLLEGLRALGHPVSLSASHGTALWHILTETSVRQAARVERVRPIIVHVLNIESTAAAVWQKVPQLESVEVKVKTHTREGVIHSVASAARTILLELHEHTLSRLLVRRIDVAQAVREERIAVTGATQADIDALTDALSPCPWVYHEIDGL